MKSIPGLALVALTIASVGCGGDDDPIAPVLGNLDVVTVTTGDDIDVDGYIVTVDGVDGPAIDVNATVTLEDLPAGAYVIELAGIAANCAVEDNPRTVDVVGNETGTTQFDVSCEGPPANEPPVADAGADQRVRDRTGNGSESVLLDGSASVDPDGTIISWIWSEDEIDIASGDTATVVLAVGVHTVTLSVADDEEAVDTDQVVITVQPAPAATSFAADIQPYFEAGMANCVQCHSGGGPAGVDLDSYANIMAGGDNGPLVVAGNSADASALLVPQLEADHNDGPDDAGFVVTLKQWIDEGAQDN